MQTRGGRTSSRKPDVFGLHGEELIRASGVRDVFTPYTPISKVEFFFGRQREVRAIIEQLGTPGQHSLLYGERGVGKSSLASVASDMLLGMMVKGKLYYARCDSDSTFETILQESLKSVGVDSSVTEVRTMSGYQYGGEVDLKLVSGQGKKAGETTETATGPAGRISPSWAFKALAASRGLLVVDEADRIADPEDRRKIAEFIKLLSDGGSEFKVLVVGVAETGEALIGAHPSVARCLRETRLRRMTEQELAMIVHSGAEKLNLYFDATVIQRIVDLSAGYPHFTHLLALKAAEEAILLRLTHVDAAMLSRATQKAVADAEGSLRRQYEAATRSGFTEMYREILCAAARLPNVEFSAKELRMAIGERTGDVISQGSLNNFLQKLVSDGGGTILRRVTKGIYRFEDPRMPSFIRIACNLD